MLRFKLFTAANSVDDDTKLPCYTPDPFLYVKKPQETIEISQYYDPETTYNATLFLKKSCSFEYIEPQSYKCTEIFSHSELYFLS